MPKNLTAEEAAAAITSNHQVMDNGELRYRLMAKEGYGYILTVAGPQGAWQNSHLHRAVRETYIVQNGWMAMATYQDGVVDIRVYRPGETITTEIGVPHNVYLPAGAVTHTVKRGDTAETSDWTAVKELDEITKPLSETEIFRLARALKPRLIM